MSDRKYVIGITPYKDAEGKEYVPPRYISGIENNNGEMVVISRATPLDEIEYIVAKLDGMLFSGGVDVDPARYGAEREPECGNPDHARDELELRLIDACMKRRMPILGICRGCQVINVGLGGTLVQDIPTRYGTLHQMPKDHDSPFWHDVKMVPGTMLHEIMGDSIPVDSYHHQCVLRLAEGLVASAHAPEGFVEAFEMPKDAGQFLMAVQWHPEVTLEADEYSNRIFALFSKAIGEYLGK